MKNKNPATKLSILSEKEMNELAAKLTNSKDKFTLKEIDNTRELRDSEGNIYIQRIEVEKTKRPPLKFMTSDENVSAIERQLKTYKKDFTLKVHGAIREVTDAKGNTWIGFSASQHRNDGYHLCKMVRTEVEDYLTKNTIAPHTKITHQQLFNLEGIRKHIGEPLISLDMNNCYWRTGFLRGFISEKLYITGMRKKEWKVGRNASWGALAKETTEMTYKNGVIVPTTKKITKPRIELQYVRNAIIEQVYDIAVRLKQEIGDDYTFFLTDCVFTTPKRVSYVKDFFRKYGYTVSQKSIEIIQLDEQRKVLFWKDFSQPPEKQNKYIWYSEKQCL